MTKDEAMKMALEALEADPLEMVADVDGHMVFLKDKAIIAIKEALAQEQEPVACKRCKQLEEQAYDLLGELKVANIKLSMQPQRTWVGLSDEEKHEIRYSHMTSAEFIEFIEAKLKEKNCA